MTANLGSKGLGQDLILTVGVTTVTNALQLTNCSGADFNTSDTITIIPSAGAGAGIASAQNAIIPTTVTVDSNQYDGQHFKVYHPIMVIMILDL